MESPKKKRKTKAAEAVRTAGSAVVSMLSGHLKGKIANATRAQALRLVAHEVDRQARLLEGSASGYDEAWAKGHTPDPIEVRALAMIFVQGAPNAQ